MAKINIKNKLNTKKLILLCIIAVLLVGVCIFALLRTTSDSSDDVEYETATASENEMTQTLTAAGEIVAAESETVDFSTSKTFSAMCVEDEEAVSKGQHLILYSNGTYEDASADGVVTDINAPESGTVADDTNSLTLNKTDTLSLDITVPEDQINQIAKGDSAVIIVNSDTDKNFKAKITGKKAMSTTLISEKASEVAEASESTDSSSGSSADSLQGSSSAGTSAGSGSNQGSSDPFGSESSTAYYTVSMKFDNDGSVLPGMSANCTVTLSDRSDVLTVPVEAIYFTKSDKAYVYKYDGNDATKKTVSIGESDANNVEITEGLKSGDRIRVEKQKQ